MRRFSGELEGLLFTNRIDRWESINRDLFMERMEWNINIVYFIVYNRMGMFLEEAIHAM